MCYGSAQCTINIPYQMRFDLSLIFFFIDSMCNDWCRCNNLP